MTRIHLHVVVKIVAFRVNRARVIIIRIHFKAFKGTVKARITPYKRLYEVGGTFKIYKCVIMHPHCRAEGLCPYSFFPPFPPQSGASGPNAIFNFL